MDKFLSIFTIGLLQNTVRAATPVALASMGGLFTEHAGIMNIGMDGMMLMGAFTAVACSYFFSSWILGVMFAVLVGIIVGIIFGLFVVKLKSDEFIIGIALNIFAGALTVFLLRTLFGETGSFSDPKIVGIPTVNIPLLASIPILGDLLNNNSVLVYVNWLLVALCYVAIYKTPFGIRMRAAGEKPDSLNSIGKSPELMKYAASVICGIFCALAGAHLALGYLTQFSENMSASRGFIAFACIIFGRANPLKVYLAVLLFGFLDALGLRMQEMEISSYLTSMLPYVATVFVLVVAALKTRLKPKDRAIKQND